MAGTSTCHHRRVGWLLVVVAGALVFGGIALLISQVRRDRVHEQRRVAAAFGLDPFSEERFGLREIPAGLLGKHSFHTGVIDGIDVALLWEKDSIRRWFTSDTRIGVVLRRPGGLPEGAIEHEAQSHELRDEGNTSWIREPVREILRDVEHWFRLDTAGDQLMVVEVVDDAVPVVHQVARMLVLAFGALGRATDTPERIEAAAVEQRSPAATPPRLVAGYSLVGLGGLAMFAALVVG